MKLKFSEQFFLWLFLSLFFFAGTNLFSKNAEHLLIWSIFCIFLIFIIAFAFKFYITVSFILFPSFFVSILMLIFFIFNVYYSAIWDFLLQALSIELMGIVQYSKHIKPSFILGKPVYLYVHIGLNILLTILFLAFLPLSISSGHRKHERRYRSSREISSFYNYRRRR